MLTPREVQRAKEAMMAPLAELRAVVLANLDGERQAVALQQLENLRRWLTRQIEESGLGSG